MTYSFVIAPEDARDAPPFSDSCPRCARSGVCVPYATTTEGSTLVAFYRHRRCGHQWSCRWEARWSHTWRAA